MWNNAYDRDEEYEDHCNVQQEEKLGNLSQKSQK